jgi:hypothetical protein
MSDCFSNFLATDTHVATWAERPKAVSIRAVVRIIEDPSRKGVTGECTRLRCLVKKQHVTYPRFASPLNLIGNSPDFPVHG